MEKKTSGYYREECNKIAWIYDPAASLISAIFGGEKRLRERILKLADIKSGDKVLDIGCGTGTSALIIAKDVGDEGEVVGIDLSSRMLDIARKKLKRSGFRNVTFLQANAEDIPYPDSYFDKDSICCPHEMNHEGRVNTLREIYRLLKRMVRHDRLIDLPEKDWWDALMRFLLAMFEGETARDMILRGIDSEIKEAGSSKLGSLKSIIWGAGQVLLIKERSEKQI